MPIELYLVYLKFCTIPFLCQMPLSVALHSMARELVQFFWMMWNVLEMRAGYWTVSIMQVITVSTVEMLVLYVTEHVSNNILD